MFKNDKTEIDFWLLLSIPVAIMIGVLATLLVTITGCHLVEVNMVQRAGVNTGAEAEDDFSGNVEKADKDEMELIVPLK